MSKRKWNLCNYHQDSLGWDECSEGFEGCEVEQARKDAAMYDTFKVECPHCHCTELLVVEATHTASGSRLCFAANLMPDGFAVPVPDDMDGSTEDEVVRCKGCTREFPLAELLID